MACRDTNQADGRRQTHAQGTRGRYTGRGDEAAQMEARAKAIRAKYAEQNPAN